MPDNDDLLFFSRISASVSHELKNVLAVINEQAGLLEDLAGLAGRGMPLDPDRLATAAACLLRQVRRGDAIVDHLNHFAHSADAPCREVSLAETAILAAALGQRQAAMRQVALTAVPGTDATVETSPFVLYHLLAVCLERAMDAPDAAKSVTVAVETNGGDPSLIVAGLEPRAQAVEDAPEQLLAARLGARLERHPGSIAIILPQRRDG